MHLTLGSHRKRGLLRVSWSAEERAAARRAGILGASSPPAGLALWCLALGVTRRVSLEPLS